MNVYKPIITKELLQISNIQDEINLFLENGETTENKIFDKFEDIDINAEDMEFEKCIFKNCKITGTFEKAVFRDVIFENCDFSNCLMMENSFMRVEIKDSKFVGCNFTDSRLYHLICENSIFQYANFNSATIEDTIFDKSDLTKSFFDNCNFKNVYFENSKLIETSFFKTKLKDIDVSSCEFSGITTSIEDVKGLIVNNFQAIELSKLLGIVIK